MSYMVTQRTQELGIRMALGAHRSDVIRLVLAEGSVLTLLGVTVGLVAAYSLTGLLSAQLHGITATDLGTYAGVVFAVSAVALLASYIPARRATRVDPLRALRNT
jgi:ABC-type antimicrobial peptide transport system permease subunit